MTTYESAINLINDAFGKRYIDTIIKKVASINLAKGIGYICSTAIYRPICIACYPSIAMAYPITYSIAAILM